MRINNNIMSMNTQRQLMASNAMLSKSVQKLSSGLRVNSAADDAAGLSISEKMRAQIAGMNMASKNSQDAISLVQTAEGALQGTQDTLQRMRELAVQASSDTNQTCIDREALNTEYQKLMRELNSTADTARFNDMGTIDGSYSSETVMAVDSSASTTPDNLSVTVNAGAAVAAGDLSYTATADGNKITLDFGGGNTLDVNVGDTKAVYNDVVFSFDAITEADVATNDSAQAIFGEAGTTVSIREYGGQSLTVQSGPNEGHTTSLNIGRMDSGQLGIAETSLLSQEGASDAIAALDRALNSVSDQRSRLGAMQNRLSYKVSNLSTSSINLQAAESTIRDVDMAKEVTRYTAANIRQQAGLAMLAQTNQISSNALTLLRPKG